MDKREYQEKLNEINRLIAGEDYAQAAAVADSIDWKRVRNVSTLVMVSEIYEAVERFEDSKVLLMRAYRRSPLGRTVLYRLVECTIRLGQFDEAIEYYSEYVQAAPHDNNKYILKYKIYKGRGSSIDEQIDILKEYLNQEYNEKWALELAKLQIQADRTQEAITTCDDLVLWFHSGKYVIRALELKKKYAPLTRKQQEIYDNRFNEESSEDEEQEVDATSYLRQAQTLAKAERAAAAQEVIKNELAEEVTSAAKVEHAKEEISQKAAEAADAVNQTAAQSEQMLADRMEEIAEKAGIITGEIPAESILREEAGTKGAAEEPVKSDADSVSIPAAETAGDMDEKAGGTPDEEDEIPEEEAAAAAAEAGFDPEEKKPAEPSVSYYENEEKMQEDMVRSMREIVAGVGPRTEPDEEEIRINEAIEQSKEDQERAVAARGADMGFHVPTSAEPQKREAKKLSIDDILLSMGGEGERVREMTAADSEPEAEPVPIEQSEITGIDERDAVVTERAAEDAAAAETEQTAEVKGPSVDKAEAVNVIEADVKADAEEAAAIDTAAEAEDLPAVEESVKTVETDAKAAAAAENPAAGAEAAAAEAVAETAGAAKLQKPVPAVPSVEKPKAPKPVYTKEIAEAPTKRIPVAEIQRALEAKAEQTAAAAEMEASEEAFRTQTVSEENLSGKKPQTEPIPKPRFLTEEIPPQDAVQENEQKTAQDKAQSIPAQDAAQKIPAHGVRPAAGTVEIPTQDDGVQIYGSRPIIQESQKDLFRGFLGIGELEEQIANAITQAKNKKGDRTSRSGNILILGAHGCGKTTIATGIAKAIAEEMNNPSVKMARIYAADMNRKDIAATIAKIAGGVLIVEEAGDLEDAVVDQLTTAMEFRTDGLIVILEDEQKYIHDLLMRHPRFTMKFTAQIYVPQYSSSDLVNFGKLYAESRDYVFSDQALGAFYDRVETAAQSGEAISVSNVVELVDRAIHNANKFFRRIGSAKKRYDEQDRVILKEKDFR